MISLLRIGVLGLAVAIIGCAPAASAAEAVTITFHYSHFDPDVVAVPAGKPITFTLRNDDPITHEWIIGPPEIHAIHRTGTEAVHDTRPTEVTVPPYSTRVTTITFDQPGPLAYMCHLPGHEEYGMKGLVSVQST